MSETVTITETTSSIVEVDQGILQIENDPPVRVLEIASGELVIVETTDETNVVEVEPDVVVAVQETAPTLLEIGIVGPQGPPGSSGSAPQSHVHTQAIPSSTWTINHNLGYIPNVWVENTLGEVCIGEVSATDNNQLVVVFSAAFAGWAYLS